MIELTKIGDSYEKLLNPVKIFINIDNILHFHKNESSEFTIIQFVNHRVYVSETTEEIKRKIQNVKGSNFILN
jgi:hypothetical protein